MASEVTVEQIIRQLRLLPEEKLAAVYDFVSFLGERTEGPALREVATELYQPTPSRTMPAASSNWAQTDPMIGQVRTQLSIIPDPLPLRIDKQGVARVSNTRVTLDTIVTAFLQGETPDGIAEQYPTVTLTDIYTVLGYYLKHRESVDAYLQERREIGDRIRRENELRFDHTGTRERLLARLSSLEAAAHAEVGR